MANLPGGPKPLVFADAAPTAPATSGVPKALSFGSEPAVQAPVASLGPTAIAAPEPVASGRTPGALTFSGDLPSHTEARPVRALFAQDEHPAMQSTIATARQMFPDMYRREAHRMDAHFRQLLPIRVSTVLAWAEKHVLKGPELSQQAAGLVQELAKLDVPALLAEALESTQPPTGLLKKLLQRQRAPSEFQPLLRNAGAALDRIREDAEKCSAETSEFGETLTVQMCSLVVIAEVAGQAPDAALGEALSRRRTLIQQTVQQAGLSLLQLAELRRQAVDLSTQVSSFLTVTLPAITMAQASG